MAKNQLLALNTAKLSGQCGNLMCCLRYEDEAYKDLKEGFNKLGFVGGGDGENPSVNRYQYGYMQGIMEAANRGAFEYGGRSVGLNITLNHEQHPNPYLTEMMEFRYFFARKVMLAMASKAYVVFPGGFGTMDEFSEVLILMQEHKMPKMPLFLYGKSFWKPLDKFFSKYQSPYL